MSIIPRRPRPWNGSGAITRRSSTCTTPRPWDGCWAAWAPAPPPLALEEQVQAAYEKRLADCKAKA